MKVITAFSILFIFLAWKKIAYIEAIPGTIDCQTITPVKSFALDEYQSIHLVCPQHGIITSIQPDTSIYCCSAILSTKYENISFRNDQASCSRQYVMTALRRFKHQWQSLQCHQVIRGRIDYDKCTLHSSRMNRQPISCSKGKAAVSIWFNQGYSNIVCCYYDRLGSLPRQNRFKRQSSEWLQSWNKSAGIETTIMLLALIASLALSMIACTFCHQKRSRTLSFADLTRKNESRTDERKMLPQDASENSCSTEKADNSVIDDRTVDTNDRNTNTIVASYNNSGIYLNASPQDSKKVDKEGSDTNGDIALRIQADDFRQRTNTDEYERPLSKLFRTRQNNTTDTPTQNDDQNADNDNQNNDRVKSPIPYDPYEAIENILRNLQNKRNDEKEITNQSSEDKSNHVNDQQSNNIPPTNDIDEYVDVDVRQEDHVYAVYFEPADTETDLVEQLSRHIKFSDVTEKESIGHGAFAEVKRGFWYQEAGKPIEAALKILKSEATTGERIKFFQEAVIMQQFSHANIVQFYGMISNSSERPLVINFNVNSMYIELIFQLFLFQRPTKEATPIFLQFARDIASGMEYLSECKFIHRDLASRNILLNSSKICKIGDFGMARNIFENDIYSSSGGKVPIKWTSPEAITTKKYSVASDVWSYGILLWEIWSYGLNPYPGWDNTRVVEEVLKGYRLPPAEGCPRKINSMIERCWAENPQERPTFKAIHSFMKMDQNILLGLSDENPYDTLNRFRSGVDNETATLILSSIYQDSESKNDEKCSTYVSVTDDEKESATIDIQVQANGNSEEPKSDTNTNVTNLEMIRKNSIT
ncbi:Ephrin type-B receptor 3 [Trichoplax sp. H2]|nr:Ephrin type-B receptor 3 [Trichoplax sp. H2]|eukprot:RDD41039.1 Ephrin type-B receptor 3 [Trichoplax sp. H2]